MEIGKKLYGFLETLKPFFNLKVNSLEDAISLFLGIGVFGVIVFQAIFVDVTYDESYTYLNTGRIQDVWKIYQFRIANTHILNSVLMTFSTLLLPYNNIAIRLPSVLISAFYISVAISLSKRFKNSLTVLGLLLLFYFVIEFMALGRGYGMCATFILATIFVFKNKNQFKSFHLWVVYLLLLAIYANYVAIVTAFAIVAYLFIFYYKWKIPETTKKHKRWIIGLLAVALYGFYSVTLAGKPLYGAYNQSFYEAIPLNLTEMFLGINHFSLSLIKWSSVVFAVVVINIFIFSHHKNQIGIITLFTFSVISLLAWLGDKPLPTGRVLIPFWPLIVLSIVEVLEKLVTKLKTPKGVLRVLNILVLAFLVFNFQSQIHFSEMVQAKSNQWKRPIATLSEYGKNLDPDEIYYLEKDRFHNDLVKKLAEVKPSETRSGKAYQSNTYNSLGLIAFNFPTSAKAETIFRQASLDKAVVYQDTISLGQNGYFYENEILLYIAYPNLDADLLTVGNVNGSWRESFNVERLK